MFYMPSPDVNYIGEILKEYLKLMEEMADQKGAATMSEVLEEYPKRFPERDMRDVRAIVGNTIF